MAISKYENSDIKLTVGDCGSGYIVRYWVKSYELESDCDKFYHETYGGAMSRAFDLLADYTDGLLSPSYPDDIKKP